MDMQKMYIALMFFLYLIAMLSIGAFFYRRTNNMADYVLGGRKLNKWVTSLSAEASDMSGWLLMGLPGAAYLGGVSAAWIAFGLLIGTYINWRFVARRLRQYTAVSLEIVTLSDYLEHRFRDTSKMLRGISALFIVVFFLLYTASGFVAGGKLFSSVFGISYPVAVSIGAATVVIYTFLGGFSAVCWTDFLQGSLMFFSIILVPIVGLALTGGPAQAAFLLTSGDPQFFNLLHLQNAGAGIALWGAIASSMAWGLGYFGQPHILVRFMAIRSADDIKGARHIAMVWVTVSLAAAVAIGIIGRAYLKMPLEGVAAEKVYILMVSDLFPALIAGVLLSAILAAIMSTADSQLLVTSSAISEDFYKAFLRKKASDAELVWVCRFTVLAVAGIAFFLALEPESSVLDLVAYAWAGFGSAFGPAFILSLFWKRMTRGGALAGIIVGGLTVLVWRQFEGGIFTLYEMIPGFLFSSIAIVLVSRASTPPP
ncbi:MAG TPA: sodium/proline symporter PutP [Candidatus Hydrogenedentes bacterium]|nr:sodium/proline symporter PutP [Candidatus Hydrogenedentota bacterium]